jgi:hypothetical protein
MVYSYEGVACIKMVQVRVYFVNMVMNLQVPQKMDNFFTSWDIITFLRSFVQTVKFHNYPNLINNSKHEHTCFFLR